jgi:hypothetical protein
LLARFGGGAAGRAAESLSAQSIRTSKLLNGTKIAMPGTAENQNAFPLHLSQVKSAGLPHARLCTATALPSGGLLAAACTANRNRGHNGLDLVCAKDARHGRAALRYVTDAWE